jgi:hypothetical protein
MDWYKPHTIVHIIYKTKYELFSHIGVLLILDFKQSELKHVFKICCAYPDESLLYFMALICSFYLVRKNRPVCPMYCR